MNKTKKGIVAFLLTAALLVSVVGMASGGVGSQNWFLKDSGTGACTGDYEMHKTSGHGANFVELNTSATASYIWCADENATVVGGVDFVQGTWTGILDYVDDIQGGFLDVGETMTVEIGSLSDTGVFTSAMTQIHSPTVATGKAAATVINVAPGSDFTVPKDHCLALRLTVSSMVHVGVNGVEPSASYIQSPSVDPGYPVPELSTLVLLSFGLLALFGYVGYRRRNNKQ